LETARTGCNNGDDAASKPSLVMPQAETAALAGLVLFASKVSLSS
jgi:hypothetical protein